MMADRALDLLLQTQQLGQDAGGHAQWQVVRSEKRWPVAETAILLCDVWDRHWSQGAMDRVEAMAPRINQVVQRARAGGIQIIHSPSDTMAFYAASPARQRMVDVPRVDTPPLLEHEDPPLPIDDSDGGSDTGERPWHKAWSRQHPAIEVDADRDAISDDGAEIHAFMRQRGIEHLLLMGVHTNMCVLNRSFGIKQMIRWGVDVALVRDLTDTMYNPAMPPYVSHEEGTRLVVAYIEKFWCPTIDSTNVIKALGALESAG